MDSKKIEKYDKKIEKLGSERTKLEGSRDALTESQERLYKVIKGLAGSDNQKILQNPEIEAAYVQSHNGAKLQLRVTDFCYNKVNLDDNKNKFLLSVGKAQVRCVDFDWSNEQEEEITWKMDGVGEPFVVGTYHNREFSWDFKDITHYLDGKRSAK